MKKTTKRFLYGIIALAGLTATGVKIASTLQKKQCREDSKNPFEGKKVIFVENEEDPENADGVRGHLEPVSASAYTPSFYDKYVKRGLDIVLSFGGIVALSPLLLGIAAAIKIDDPGPVFFTQKRLGQNKKYFRVYKFRSMKMSTPHDTPTHMLENPEQYITRVGKFLRAHSLDELPQLFNVLDGSLSLVGPRPGLWNQDVLTAERDKYGVNEYKPGITGWAQINGRDSISIEQKSELDGYGVRHSSLIFDLKCLLGTVTKVGHDDTVVEGGTGAMERTEKNEPTDYIGTFPKQKKKILITGKNSYIGENIKDYLSNQPDYYDVEIIETKGLKPSVDLFLGYDVVINVAGIAHIKETDENRKLYYEINRDLCVNIAKMAKKAGVKQFIVLSSMSVYGMAVGHIMKYTEPMPTSAYGDSKYQADKKIMELETPDFKISILRPPMVYGKGCKGNYQLLRKFAVKSPVFPKYKNERSMIYIGNLCEFCKNVIDEEKRGIFFPQNEEYVNTTEMVRSIAKYNNSPVVFLSVFTPFIKMINCNVIKKVFGNLTYEKTDLVSKYSFEKTIELSEARNEKGAFGNNN